MKQVQIYGRRVQQLINCMKTNGIDAFLLNDTGIIAYLTGVASSCSWVFITKEGRQIALVLDSDAAGYEEESTIEDVRSFKIHDPVSMFANVAAELGLNNAVIALDASGSQYDIFKDALPSTVRFVGGAMLLAEIRAIKTDDEIELLKKAALFAWIGMDTAVMLIRPGIRESEVAIEVEYAVRKAGGRLPIASYVGSGRRAGMAHAFPSGKRIQSGDVVTLDISAAYQGFGVDLARTVVCGAADEAVMQAYSYLRRAQEEAIDLCCAGRKLEEISRVFYGRLHEAKGFKSLMGPVLHGVGIAGHHEMPHFERPHHQKGHPESLAANMVLAVSNIGLYWGQGLGVRIEDTICVTDNGPVYLTSYDRELLTL